MSMFTKIRRKMIYHEGLQLKKLHDPLITQHFDINSQMENVKSQLPKFLNTPNIAAWWLRMKVFRP